MSFDASHKVVPSKPDMAGHRHPPELLRAESNSTVRAEVTSSSQKVINRSMYLKSTRLRAVNQSDGRLRTRNRDLDPDHRLVGRIPARLL